ncbi:hypothetical protein QP027_07335 [Corynebacterium breve]|uniref:Secreted protein n=1 Tax=Corynebacterium breve TaxID=3049799 RepID=A0ABY8VBE1_9CORY|nr:hypothetical protein [Corynebacterium breve]WIM66946.1 hypothetical protein QP027_07335 [Corynebacterium breve]
MTMQRRNPNPIEARKEAVRKYSRNAVVWAGGGVVGGVALALLFSSWTWIAIGLVVAVVGGVSNYMKVQKIINHHDNY